MEKVTVALNEAMRSTAGPTSTIHRKRHDILCKHMVKDETAFKEVIMDAFEKSLTVIKREKVVENLIDFILSYINYLRESHPRTEEEYVLLLLENCTKYSYATDKAARFRSCQYIGRLLSQLPDEVDFIPDSLWEKMEVALIERSKDKFVGVRSMAMFALRRLQDPTDNDNAPLSAIVRGLTQDQAFEVRKASLESVGVSKLTLPLIIKRTKDSKAEVRVAAYNVLRDSVDLRTLSISQRASLLKDGLGDREEEVREAAADMLQSGWLKTKNGSVVHLLSSLDVENYDEGAAMAVKALLGRDRNLLRESAGVRSEDQELTGEAVFFWRVKCEYLNDNKMVDALDDTLPDIGLFCSLMSRHQESDFIIKQLLRLCPFLDMTNEGGRKNMVAMLTQFLVSLSFDDEFELINDIMPALSKAHVSDNSFVRAIVELLADLSDPAEERNEGEVEAESNVSSHDARLLRCLAIIATLLETTTEGTSNPLLAGLFDTYILPAITNVNPFIRGKGVACLALYCFLPSEEPNVPSSMSHCNLLFHAARSDVDGEVTMTAKKALFDSLMVFKTLPPMATLEGEDVTMGTILQLLCEDLDADDKVVRLTAVKGFAKLLFSSRLANASVLSRLLLLYFTPLTEDDEELRQFLSLFFPSFAMGCAEGGQLLQASVIPTLTEVLFAEEGSPLKDISIEKLLTFVLFLLTENTAKGDNVVDEDGNHKEGKTASSITHTAIAIDLAVECIAFAQHKSLLKECSKVFNSMLLSGDDQVAVKVLMVLIDKIASIPLDSITSKAYTKILASLQKLDKCPQEALDEDKVALLESRVNDRCEYVSHFCKENGIEFEAVVRPTRKAAASKKAVASTAKVTLKGKVPSKRARKVVESSESEEEEEDEETSESESDNQDFDAEEEGEEVERRTLKSEIDDLLDDEEEEL